MCESIVPGVQIVCSPAIISVFEEIIISISSMMSGLPAFPTPIIFPSLIPISALMIPKIGSITIALVITRSSDSALVTPLACPCPSRTLFPPPNTASSPYLIKSFSISIIKSVSARRILSPTVGPNKST